MSSNNPYLWAPVAMLLAVSLARAQETPRKQTLSCPATIRVTETARAVDSWKGSTVTVERPFERVSIYNGEDGGKEYELAPDEQKEEGKRISQLWNLKGYRSMNIFMRCRYRDTGAVLSINIPATIQTCRFIFELDPKGKILGKPTAGCQ